MIAVLISLTLGLVTGLNEPLQDIDALDRNRPIDPRFTGGCYGPPEDLQEAYVSWIMMWLGLRASRAVPLLRFALCAFLNVDDFWEFEAKSAPQGQAFHT